MTLALTRGHSNTRDVIGKAYQVIRSEADALLDYIGSDDVAMKRAIEMIYASTGPLIVSGIGKSGHIANKIASTFRSLGKPATFLHAAEASHGDLGVIHADSVVLVLSNSGETSELSDLLHYCQQYGIAMIGLTGRADSTLARVANVALVYGRVKEACVNGLAPTTSTTVSLAIGDALAVAVSYLMNIAPEDFRRFHPGGKLGTRLLTAADLMKSGEALPIVSPEDEMADVVVVMSEKSLGTAIVVEGGSAVGVITDGDMRRHLASLWSSKAQDVATSMPVRVSPEYLASDAVDLMNAQGITSCLVENKAGVLLGLLHLHDCLARR